MTSPTIIALTPVWLVCEPKDTPRAYDLARLGFRSVASDRAQKILFYGADRASVLGVLADPICCPVCGSNDINVIQATMVETGEIERMRSPLTKDGFYVLPESGKRYEDQSTTDEFVQCGVCNLLGPLDGFGFGLAQSNPPVVVVSADGAENVELAALSDLGSRFTIPPTVRLEQHETRVRVRRPESRKAWRNTEPAAPAVDLPHEDGFWIVEIPEVHYSRRRISVAEAPTAEKALVIAMDAGGETLDGLEYSDTIQPEERGWKVRPALSDEIA